MGEDDGLVASCSPVVAISGTHGEVLEYELSMVSGLSGQRLINERNKLVVLKRKSSLLRLQQVLWLGEHVGRSLTATLNSKTPRSKYHLVVKIR